ncbi:TIGR00297 family protein [Waterburya agarophytonicola K14]|uniref:TIGR00297 family protein n=1 Tax=Waterburya agarophytonicola KI4 TaxID=2874699 RepID=A0A964BVU7_9CYAN|nr:TIGR00297 family protein [Waterburya agarophytonicola]MCC0179571.1 TIGR00297 family protein [Waterburya agarophytonicola KI4]
MFNTLSWSNPWSIALTVNSILLGIAWFLPKKLLTPLGYLNALILGVLVWGTLGWRGYLIVMFFFLCGSALTFVGIDRKEAEGIAEERSGVRGAGNVWGSALTATICAIATLFFPSPWRELLVLGYVASFCTKLSDTTASEVGKAYGKTTYLITTLKPVPRGTEGAVSLEGTLAGIAASVVLGAIAWAIGMISPIGVIWCVIAAFIATTIESWIGATLESRFTWLTNDLVNFINTVIGAISAILLGWII